MRQESNINKLERGRAEFAYDCVVKAIKESKANHLNLNDYRSYCRKIPMMILRNGLGQTLVFVKAKAQNSKAYNLLYDQMDRYLRSGLTTGAFIPTDREDLIEWAVSCNSADYRYITQELLSFLNWIKRFTEGMIDERVGEGQ